MLRAFAVHNLGDAKTFQLVTSSFARRVAISKSPKIDDVCGAGQGTIKSALVLSARPSPETFARQTEKCNNVHQDLTVKAEFRNHVRLLQDNLVVLDLPPQAAKHARLDFFVQEEPRQLPNAQLEPRPLLEHLAQPSASRRPSQLRILPRSQRPCPQPIQRCARRPIH